ncbi:peptidase inhibitor family I36 protein [Streptomyces sp. NPDC088270]|uniref:peptidase inhibitor family I36 protein n=1 Tax=unclassified Streptomyces TaxID=2593676 RepID=UPI00343D329C
MNPLRTFSLKRTTLAATAMAAVGAVTLGLAPTASATSTNIDTWSSFWQPCGTYMCLYYSPNLTGASWTPAGTSDSNLSGNKFANHGTGSAGAGQVVRNNAASMGNHTTNCHVAVFYSPGFKGDANWLHAGHAGNLNSALRNNNASIRVDSCT